MNFPIELPEDYLRKAEELEIDAAQIEENYVRGSGKGGQKKNKTCSCVQLRHVPTEISVSCQKHREQSLNRISAYKLLIRKIEAQVKGVFSDEAKRIAKIRRQKAKRTKRSKEKMLEEKHRNSEKKALRRPVNSD